MAQGGEEGQVGQVGGMRFRSTGGERAQRYVASETVWQCIVWYCWWGRNNGSCTFYKTENITATIDSGVPSVRLSRTSRSDARGRGRWARPGAGAHRGGVVLVAQSRSRTGVTNRSSRVPSKARAAGTRGPRSARTMPARCSSAQWQIGPLELRAPVAA